MSERNLEVGQTLGESLPAMATRATVGVIGPDGTRKDVRMTLDAQASRWSFADTKQSGVYAIELGPPIVREEAYAVNVGTAESDLTRLPSEELPKEFVTHRHNNLDDAGTPSIGRRNGLHKLLLYGVLGLLFFESFLAWRFTAATQ